MFLSKRKTIVSAIALVAGLLFFSSQAVAQGKSDTKLVGKVVQASSKKDVSGATVTIEGMDKEFTTNKKGMFSIDSLEPGTYTITIEADGYKDWEKEIEVKAKGNTLKAKLKPEKNMKDDR